MSEGEALSFEQVQNGHQGYAPTRVTLSGADEVLGPPAGRAEGRGDIFSREDGQGSAEGRRQSAAEGPHRGFGGPHVVAQPEFEPARGHSTALSLEAREAEDLLSRARSHAESLGAQARAEAQELLSRAQSQAEMLRVHAEAMRAEADCLRAEAAALRSAVARGAVAKGSDAEAVAAPAPAAAEGYRSAPQLEIDVAREELERIGAEAILVRRALRAEIDAGLEDVDRMRGEVRRLCAETNKLAAELGLLFSAGGPERMAIASDVDVRSPEPVAAQGRNDDPVVVDSSLEGDQGHTEGPNSASADDQGAEPGRRPPAAGPHLDRSVAELLRQIWDAASAGLGRLSEDPSSGAGGWRTGEDRTGAPTPGPFETRRPEREEPGAEAPVEAPFRTARSAGAVEGLGGSEPLIGSGGWRAKQAGPAETAPIGGEAVTPPPPPARPRRRFHRG